MSKYPYNFAVPSWVLKGDVVENVQFLKDKVKEIELLCFEPALPPVEEFLNTSCSWHIHLPTHVPADFFINKEKYLTLPRSYDGEVVWIDPWAGAKTDEDIDFFAYVCKMIFVHCQDLKPHCGVVHLPSTQTTLAEEKLLEFIYYWQEHLSLNTLALENVYNASFLDYKNILTMPKFQNLGLCLDVAHALSFAQTDCLLSADIMKKVSLLHWSAPDFVEDIKFENLNENALPEQKVNDKKPKDRHLGLYHLEAEREFCKLVMQNIPKNITHVLEIFNWEEIEKSVEFFQSLAD